ncbi:hypothetical protein NL676_008507 [Syzygium grande]|nr:hypothetical protein NL676_008507 [Syzygium grande]
MHGTTPSIHSTSKRRAQSSCGSIISFRGFKARGWSRGHREAYGGATGGRRWRMGQQAGKLQKRAPNGRRAKGRRGGVGLEVTAGFDGRLGDFGAGAQ